LNVPLFVIPPLKVTGELAEVFVQVAPAATVTKPVNNFVPVADVIFSAPLVPPPTVVVPDTVKLKAPTLSEHPFWIIKFDEAAEASTR